MFAEDLYDIACLCHAALAQDSPQSSDYYINQIMNYTWAHLPSHYKKKVETYLAEKEYLPPVKLLATDGSVLDTQPVVVLNENETSIN